MTKTTKTTKTTKQRVPQAVGLPQLHVGSGRVLGPLTVFPVWSAAPVVPGVAVGAAAHVEVAEREGSPVVGELLLTNHGELPALLVEGELLEGGWQHRTMLHDVLLAAGESMVAAVACVEAGRWHGQEAHVRRSRRASGTMRAALAADTARDPQQEVWERVSRYADVVGASPTMSFLDNLDGALGAQDPCRAGGSHRPPTHGGTEQVLREVELVRPLDGQRGIIVGMAGQPVLLELYPTQEALAEAIAPMLAGLVLDALATRAPSEPVPSRRARRLVERLAAVRAHPVPGSDAGAGTLRGAGTDHAVVRGLTLDNDWVHLTAFNRHHDLLELV